MSLKREIYEDAKDINFETSESVKCYLNFEEMNLKEELLRGIYSYAICNSTEGHSCNYVRSQSGTGKTATFAIAALNSVDKKIKSTQVLILSPTRELAKQTGKVFGALGDFLGARCYTAIGGTNVKKDMMKLKLVQNVVCGTPGRILELIEKGYLRVNKLKMLILDESDEILDQGFKDKIYEIYRKLSPSVQVILVSATLPDEVMALTSDFMTNPVNFLVSKRDIMLEVITQFHVDVKEEGWKFSTLCEIYGMAAILQSIIFCNSRKKAVWLANKLMKNNFTVSLAHGKISQDERDAVLNEFRMGKSRVLVSTDIWARGIDVSTVTLVVNFDLPTSKETYIHRIGRVGRFGRKGIVINLITSPQIKIIRSFEKFFNINITPMPSNCIFNNL